MLSLRIFWKIPSYNFNVNTHKFYNNLVYTFAMYLEAYQAVQSIAKRTIDYLAEYIRQGVTESDIASAANEFMKQQGVSSFWYHGVGSLVLVGERTTLSVSGTKYEPSDEVVSRDDLVTIDLSPQIEFCWGDFARSLVISNGRVVQSARPNYSDKVNELFEGIGIEHELHQYLQGVATPEMTFDELYQVINGVITDEGFVNLDFNANLGHTIETDKNKREYLVAGCKTRLAEKLFTFEPHIKRVGGLYGYKMEDIYFFLDGCLERV